MKIAQTLKFHFEHKSNVSPGEKEKGSRGREGLSACQVNLTE